MPLTAGDVVNRIKAVMAVQGVPWRDTTTRDRFKFGGPDTVVTGIATEVGQLHEVLDLLRLPVFPWEPGAKPHLVRIHPESISGRQFSAVDLLGKFAT